MTLNKKGQESGTLQSLLLAVLIMSGVAYFAIGYLNGIANNYDIPINESQYAVFSTFDEVNETLGSISNQFISEEPGQVESTDIISVMVTSAYGTIKLMLDVPNIYLNLVTSAVQAIGFSSQQASVITGVAVGFIVLLVLFAIIALIMKVRA